MEDNKHENAFHLILRKQHNGVINGGRDNILGGEGIKVIFISLLWPTSAFGKFSYWHSLNGGNTDSLLFVFQCFFNVQSRNSFA